MYQPSANRQPITCEYQDHTCSRSRLEGYEYCVRHILEDKSAPFKQCNYVYSNNGRRCIMPAPKTDKRDSGFCAEHTRKAQLVRQKSSRRHVPPPSTETLLLSLAHYARPESQNNDNNAVAEDLPPLRETNEDDDVSGGKDSEDCTDVVTRALNPFAEIDATKVNNNACLVLDYASESDSDLEVATFSGTWRGVDMDSSDAESIDGSLEDPCKCGTFRHAGVYTAEEVAQLTRDKLIRLQSLYIDQFRRLQQALKERRRKYLHALKKEKETLCSIHSQTKDSVREQKLYLKLKSLNRYKKLSGVEATLHKKNMERRTMAEDDAREQSASKSVAVRMVGGDKPKTSPVKKETVEGDPSESFNSETSTTDTASNVGSLENMEEC
ncbi:KAT8 regulatory NSL complex subunit 2 isoform X2 [Anabrus simplex]|uniref:KAT8 regulatory NSL complex subunit 2 isoform X2 n=1 Tax=Anabrus simplex TaxID=316456 RepID=UPI0034DCF2E6